MEYSLERQEITRVCLDYAVALETADGAELRIECQFVLAAPDGSSATPIIPDDLANKGARVAALLHQQIVRADIAESGALLLTFESGTTLGCQPDERFEAWTLVSPGGERMVCLPGGGVAHWSSG